ncbi:uncharacterized protein F58A4.6-like [Teleopsis dalmanni]|uniref:uncharacterized protein F58A4.6-like n=1 Tax=Teleopsis dalmanni TaxID=139649 RepID=UPI000D32C508|nr:uncharacterized protein F58A4.6-like [Teleopsis dalmanni]
MITILCINDLYNKREYFSIAIESELKPLPSVKSRFLRDTNNKILSLKGLELQVDGYQAFYILRELREFNKFRQLICTNPALEKADILCIRIIQPEKDVIDYKWNHMLSYILWEHIEMEHLMSWLSTLGGGFSALGEQFSKFAETAGRISLKQLSIGMRLGDPFLQARCKLYYSISLIQTGRLRQAKHLVRQQYTFAKTQKEIDSRLVKMCLGIWLRIQYEYRIRMEKKALKQNLLGAGDSIYAIKTS